MPVPIFAGTCRRPTVHVVGARRPTVSVIRARLRRRAEQLSREAYSQYYDAMQAALERGELDAERIEDWQPAHAVDAGAAR